MPPRRSSRAPPSKAEPKPASKKAPASKPAKAPTSKPAKAPAAKAAKAPASKAAAAPKSTGRGRPAKRAAEPESRESSTTPPAKRLKASSSLKENGVVPTEEEKKTEKKTEKPEENSEEEKEGKEEKPKGKATKAAEKKAVEKKKPAKVVETKPPFNPLPAPNEHLRPAPLLFIWGTGNFGQLGAGEDMLDEITKPQRNKLVEQKIQEGAFGEPGAGLESIAAGGMFSLLLDEQGKIWSAGVNDDAALGRVTEQVPDPENEGKFLDADTLTAQFWPLQSLVDEGFRATRIAAGDSIGAAISQEGDLRAWGSFRSVEGLLGFSSDQKHQFTPIPILEIKSKPNDPEKFVSVAAGNNHLVVLTTHGHIYTWGAGEQGQLGRKVIERRKAHGMTPERIILGTRTRKAVYVGAGNYTSFAVDDKGDVWAWGLNNAGQTGTGFTTASADGEVQAPRKIDELSADAIGPDRVVQVAGGEHHTIFRTEAGKVYACGKSTGGQLGLPDDHPVFQDRDDDHKDLVETPTLVPFPDDDDPVVHIAAGVHNNLAITRDGALFTWGTGPQNELGAQDEVEIKTPRMIVRRTGGAWAGVTGSCGGQHTIALMRKKE